MLNVSLEDKYLIRKGRIFVNGMVNGEAFVNCPYSTGSDTLRGCLDTSAL